MKATTYEDGTDLASTAGTPAGTRQFWFLLKQDAARRSLRWSLPIALLIGLLLRTVAGTDIYDWDRMPVYAHHAELVYMLVQLWLALLFAIILSHFNSRCSSLSLGLPISPRRLWLARIVAIAAAGVLPVVTVILAISLFARGNLIDPALLRIGSRITSCVVLSVVLFQFPDPRLYRIRGTRRFKWYVGAVTVFVLIYVTVTPGSWVYTVLPLVAALALAALVYRRLPAGFTTADADAVAVEAPPREAGRGAGDSRPVWPASTAAARNWRLIRLVLRETINSWSGWLMLLLIAVNVWALMSQYYAAYHPLNDYVILMLWIWILLNRTTGKLSRFDMYPISRRLVLWTVLSVVVMAMAGGFAVGYSVHHFGGNPVTQVRVDNCQVRVPFEAWEIAWDGKPPEVVSPWGETHTPSGKSLFGRESEFCVYNPFEFGKESTPRFVAFQIDRAVERVHGPSTAIARLSDAPVDSSFAKKARDCGFKVESSLFRPSEMRERTQAVILTIWVVMFAVLAGVWWRRFRPNADYARTRWFVVLFFTVPYVVLFGLIALDARGLVSVDAALAMTMIGLRSIADAVPLGTSTLFAVCALVGIAALWYVQACFAKAESTTQSEQKSLLSEY